MRGTLRKIMMVGVMALCLGLTSGVRAEPLASDETTETGTTGLPLPRFQSLSASVVNMRSGPDERYPVSWIYQRAKLPILVLQEFGTWRKVRDPDGVEGWMSGNLLAQQRTGMIVAQTRTLYENPDVASKKLWRAEPGVVGQLVVCEEAWCQMSIDGKVGWILRDQIFGVDAQENFN